MNPRSVLLLGALVVVVLTLALVTGRDSADNGLDDEDLLLPDLREQVNDIEAIDIIDREGNTAVRLRRERERWRVREKDNYEASFEQVHDLLQDLVRMRREDERTARPDWYGRLNVADPGEDGAGVMVAFPDVDVPAVILGRVDPSGLGRYARLAGEATSWLTDRSPEVPETPLEWLERAIMDIPASELTEVTLRHPDGETVHLRPAGEEDRQWVLMNVPEGREAAPEWEIRPTANALATLNLEDVRRGDPVPDDAVSALFVTREGLNFIARLFEDDDGHWVRFSVSAETRAGENENGDEQDTELAIDAAAAHDRLAPWQFAITADRYQRMTRGLEDFLAEPGD